ncbi:MAG: acyclic terpene utilization AtuA family protein [Betaproteobacteria bacterium]
MELRVLGTFLNHGYVWPEDNFVEALKTRKPDFIAGQGTNTDPGPGYLGRGINIIPKMFVKKVRRQLIVNAKKAGVPFCISVGTSGCDEVLYKSELEIIDEVAREANIKVKLAIISGEINKDYLRGHLASGVKIPRLIDHPRLSENLTLDDVNSATRVVAQMGHEPIMKALDHNVDGVITGRAMDTALFMAEPSRRGFDKALVAHMAKVMECGAIATTLKNPKDPPTNGSMDGIFGVLHDDHFLVSPINPKQKCTIASVLSHSFYERADPFVERMPGGALNIADAIYEQVDEQTVKVSNSKWIEEDYTIKLEGVKSIGFRSISLMGIRNQSTIRVVDKLVERVRSRLNDQFEPLQEGKDYNLYFHVYGKNAILGPIEPLTNTDPHEVALLAEAVATSQELATALMVNARVLFTNQQFEGRITTAGNESIPWSPSEPALGEVHIFNIMHRMPIKDPCEPFKMDIIEFPR